MKYYSVSMRLELQFVHHVLKFSEHYFLEEIKASPAFLLQSYDTENSLRWNGIFHFLSTYLWQYCNYHAVMHNFVPVFSSNYSEEYSNSLAS